MEHEYDRTKADLKSISKSLDKLSKTLTRQSEATFKKHTESLNLYVFRVKCVFNFIKNHDLNGDEGCQRVLKETVKLLNTHLKLIKGFAPHLSSKDPSSLCTIIAKISWSSRMPFLNMLRRKLNERLTALDTLMISSRWGDEREVYQLPPSPKYYAILVTTPPVHYYGLISDKLCASEDNPEPIPWDETNPSSIPPMEQGLRFRRHFALALVEKRVWESSNKTIAAKFEGAPFWDYAGDKDKCLKGESLSSRDIANINAMAVLGIMDSRGEAAKNTCTAYHEQLRANWPYLRIWWNDGEFALCHAYLLVREPGRSKA